MNFSKVTIKPVALFVLKAAVTMLCLIFIYRKIIAKEHFEEFISFCRNLKNTSALVPFSIAVLLMPVNWIVESLKWKYLIKHEEKISFGLAFYAVVVGSAVSFFTPNRMGEFAGRILVLKPENRIRGALATVVGSVSQLLITLLFGLASLPFAITLVKEISVWEYVLLITSGIVIGFVLLKLYFNIGIISHLKIPFVNNERIKKYAHIFEEYDFKQLFHVLFLSFLRYMVYAMQFVLLFYAAGVNAGWFTVFVAVFVIFFVMTVIPSVALFDIAVRGSVALFVLQNISANNIGIFSATFALWFINLVIPAVAGTVLFGYMRISGRKEKSE